MEIINVIEILGDAIEPILSIKSFGISNEGVRDEMNEKANAHFRQLATEQGLSESNIEEGLIDGRAGDADYTIQIIYSYI